MTSNARKSKPISSDVNESKPFGRESPMEAGGQFATTRWSMVLAAGASESERSREALSTLCRTYWYPLYVYVRRKGYDYHEAQELTQEFFARLLEKKHLRVVTPERGRFRSFLLVSLKHFLANEWDRVRARKRGGGRPVLSLQMEDAEGRLALEPADELTPEMHYERQWALALLHRALDRLSADLKAAGKSALFRHVQGLLTGETDAAPYATIAEDIGMTEGAVKVAVHRMRRRFRNLLREEILQTIADPEDVDEEIRYLISVITVHGTRVIRR